MDPRPQRRLLRRPRRASCTCRRSRTRSTGYQSVNVEAAAGELLLAAALDPPDDPRPQAATRRSGSGSFTDLGGSNPSVLSYAREHVDEDGDEDVIVCVNNLSRFPQPVELDLRRWEGMVPVELLGGVPFPQVGELPYLLTLGGYGFYWFRLTEPEVRGGSPHERPGHRRPRELLAPFVEGARWFGGKGRPFSLDRRRTGSARCPAASTTGRGSPSTWSPLEYEDGGRRALPAAAGVLPRRAGPPRPRPGRRLARRGPRHLPRLRRRARPRGDGAAGCARSTPTPRAAPLDVPPAAGPRPRPRHPLDAVQRRAVATPRSRSARTR